MRLEFAIEVDRAVLQEADGATPAVACLLVSFFAAVSGASRDV